MLPAVALLLRPILAAGLRRAVGGALARRAAGGELGKTLGKRAATEAVRSFTKTAPLGRGEAGRASRSFAKAQKAAEKAAAKQESTPRGGRGFKLDLDSIRNALSRRGERSENRPQDTTPQSPQSRQQAKLASAFGRTPPIPPAPPGAEGRGFASTQSLSTQPINVAASPPVATAPPPPRQFPVASLTPQNPNRAFSRTLGIPQATPAATFNQANPAQATSPTTDTAGTARSFSSLVNKGSNFGDLLSGKKTGQQVNQEADQEDREAQHKQEQDQAEEARKQTIDSLKKLGIAAVSGGAGMLAIPGIAKKFTEALVASQQNLRRFNGSIGVAYARLDRGDILRQQQSGARTAGTLVPLVDAMNSMRNETQKVADVVSNGLNTLALPVVRSLTRIVEGVNYIADKLGLEKKAPAQISPWQRHLVDRQRRYGQNAKKGKFDPLPPGPSGKAI